MADTTISSVPKISDAMLAAYPELQAIYDIWDTNPGKAQELFAQTEFFKNNVAEVRTRMFAQVNQPIAYEKAYQAYANTTKKRLAAAGIKMDEAQLDGLLRTGYDTGLTEDQVNDLVVKSGKVSGFGGATLGSVTSLQSFANTYGVGNLLNKAYWDGKSAKLFAGETTAEDIQAEIRSLSASTFPAYADGINKGVSLYELASNVTQTISTFLEKDPNTIDFNDPLAREIASYIDPSTGKPAIMPQWMVEKKVKSQPEWAFTKNGQNTIDNLTYKVAKDWGMVY
jgi:hypothetical protein